MNDPRITAYALNEMRGEEREKFEFDLAADTRTQTDLQQATEVVGALGQVMTQPGEGLEPQAREQLLREIAQNQKIFQRRRKIVRFAMPVALAAAASIVVLLLVSGGKTTQGPAMAAADGARAGAFEGTFSAKIRAQDAVFVLSGDGKLVSPADPLSGDPAGPFRKARAHSSLPTSGPCISWVRASSLRGRTISMSESGRAALEMRADAGLSLSSPAVRMRPLIWDDELPRWSGFNQGQP